MKSSPKTYRELSVQLDEILETLQTAELDIDDAVKVYERGMQLVLELETILKTAENKIVKINQKWGTDT